MAKNHKKTHKKTTRWFFKKYAPTFLVIVLLVFLLFSFINPTISTSEIRENCQSEGGTYGENVSYCLRFSKDQKLFGHTVDIDIVEVNEDVLAYERSFDMFESDKHSKESIAKETTITWSENGIELAFEEQKTVIQSDFFLSK